MTKTTTTIVTRRALCPECEGHTRTERTLESLWDEFTEAITDHDAHSIYKDISRMCNWSYVPHRPSPELLLLLDAINNKWPGMNET